MARSVEQASEIVRHGAGGEAVSGAADAAATTPHGRRLLELHRRIVAAGDGFNTREELEREIAERRGGIGGAEEQ